MDIKKTLLVLLVVGVVLWLVKNPHSAAAAVIHVIDWFKNAGAAVATFFTNVLSSL